MSWYRTYRPTSFAELHIVPVRERYLSILSSGSFSHAYLLTGPKGTGKTSGARILAKVLNCETNKDAVKKILSQKETGKSKKITLKEPCNTCAVCTAITNGTSMCVVEMDAASNRGIDDIRSLRERIGLSPGDGRISVFIIDEVHMLTTEAFNALLKVLEEPPAHVVFILATTDPQKMPATVISRCVQIQYRKASIDEISLALAAIATKENISIENELVRRIATAGDGSFRDSVKLLESIAAGKSTVTATDMDSVLGGSTSLLSNSLLNALLKKSAADVIAVFEQVEEKGMDGVFFEKETLSLAQKRMVEFVQANDKRWQTLYALLKHITVPIEVALPIPWMPFELACIGWCIGDEHLAVQPVPTPSKEPVAVKAKPPAKAEKAQTKKEISQPIDTQPMEETFPVEIQQVAAVLTPIPEEESIVQDTPETPTTGAIELSVIEAKWTAILQAVKSKSVPVEGLLRATRPLRIHNGKVVIQAMYQFHKEQLELDRNKHVIEEVIEGVTATPVKVMFELGEGGKVFSHTSHNNISGNVPDEGLVKAATEAFL